MITGQLCTVRSTPYGGRGVYAQAYIKAGTCIQHCPAPYAYVIARKFRKEVCAWCFRYAFEHGKNTWGWKYDAMAGDTAAHIQDKGSEKQGFRRPDHKAKVIGPKYAGVSFCSAECRGDWCFVMDSGGLYAALGSTAEKLAVSDKERRGKDVSSSAVPSVMNEADGLALLKTLQQHWLYSPDVLLSAIHHHELFPIMGDTPITVARQTLSNQEQLDMIWKQAELLYTLSKGQSRDFLRLRGEQLTEFELDTAQFVISALVRRFSEESAVDSQTVSDRSLPSGPGATWSEMLELQNNEMETALRKPEIIAAHLRVYGFVRRIVEATLHAAQTEAVRDRDWTKLRTYVEKSDFIRAVLGRDHGNVFGIWDMAIQGDSEMLGWGMYVQGSYFNHDCFPNVKKQRVGRTMNFYTIRDIIPGEEMCIAYIDVNDPALQRRAELKGEWYFDCACSRCQRELEITAEDTESAVSVDVIDSVINNTLDLFCAIKQHF